MKLTPVGYIAALEELGGLWASEDGAVAALSFAALVAADETGLVN